MGLVNNTLSGISQGVTEQFDESRKDSQVSEMVNCIPNISRGIVRRNPANLVLETNNLGFAFTTKYPFIFAYDKNSNNEQYIIIIGELGKWKVINTTTNSLISYGQDLDYLGYNPSNKIKPRDLYRAVNIQDTTFITNTIREVEMNYDKEIYRDGELNSHLKTGVYWIKKTTQIATHQRTSGGNSGSKYEGYTYTLNSKGIKAEVQGERDTRPGEKDFNFTGAEQIVKKMACKLNDNDSYKGGTNTCTDSGTISNLYEYKEYETEYSEVFYTNNGNTFITGSRLIYEGIELFYSTHKAHYENEELIFDEIGVGLKFPFEIVKDNIYYKIDVKFNKTFGYNNDKTFKRESYSILDLSSYDKLINKGFVAQDSFLYNKELEAEGYNVDSWEWSDSFGNDASFGFKGVVRSTDLLPNKMPAELGIQGNIKGTGTIVKVEGISPDTVDDYWMEYTGDTWVESREPGNFNSFNPKTMPHVFRRERDGLFTFGYYGEFEEKQETGIIGYNKWDKRKVGDLESNPVPSFVCKSIKDIFFHKNRLGFLTDESVSLSEINNYSNYWNTTVRIVPDDDPIDVTVADTSSTKLSSAVSNQFNLILFGSDTQYALFSDNILTPNTVDISVITKYNFSSNAQAKSTGDDIKFISTSGNYDQLFTYRLSNGNSKPTKAYQLTSHIPSYIEKGVHKILGHSVLGYTILLTEKNLYIYNELILGNDVAQSAFHKWSLNKDVVGIEIIDNDLIIIDKDYIISKISLEIPGNINGVNYTDYNGTYKSNIKFSKWNIKDKNSLGNLRGRLQIRTLQYSITDNSKFQTIITNTDRRDSSGSLDFVLLYGTWDDTRDGIDTYWRDDSNYSDEQKFIERIYKNDKKITVSGSTDHTLIEFRENEDTPEKGFELQTLNYEGLFVQRSQRI